jgi:hypothetical protein
MDGTGEVEQSPFRVIDVLIRRIPPEAWPFLLIGILLVIRNGFLLLSGPTDLFSRLLLGAIVLQALLPVAILVGCRDEWKSARLIFVGAIVWTTIGSVLPLIVAAEQWLLPAGLDNSSSSLNSLEQVFAGSLNDGLNSLISIERSLAGIASYVGPLLVVIGLERRRRSVTVWPVPGVAAAVIAAIALGFWQGRTTLDSVTASNVFSTAGVSISDQLHVARATLLPAYLLALGALAWSCLSAVRAGETPDRFWRLVGVGAALLFAAAFWSVVDTVVMTPDLYMAVGDLALWLSITASVLGYGLLLVGFGLGLPPKPESGPTVIGPHG